MANLTLYNLLTLSGSEPTYITANSGGDRIYNPRSRSRAWVVNSGGAQDATIESALESNFGAYPDYVVSIPAGAFWILPPFSAARFNDPTDGYYKVTFDTPADIQIASVEDEMVLKGTS